MTLPQETVWEIEEHTRAKHEILRKYLGAWFPILSKHYGRILYLDGFCGPGRYTGGEPGSPLVALDVAVNHRKSMRGELIFWFIDEREDRIAHLQRELNLAQIPSHFTVAAEAGKFHERLGQVLNRIEEGKSKLAPTFAFIDPFGFSGIPYTLIMRLLRQKRTEALITFAVDSINRWLEHPDDNVVQHITEAFGDEQCLQIAKEGGNRTRKLRVLYQKQLEECADFVRFFEMCGPTNRPINYLFFATNNRLGHVKMKEAMWRVDRSGLFSFSDATNPNQIVVFPKPTVEPLKHDIAKRFSGKKAVRCYLVRLFVEDKTAYLKKHMGEVLRSLEGDEEISVSLTKTDGSKRRKGSFPDEALVDFS